MEGVSGSLSVEAAGSWRRELIEIFGSRQNRHKIRCDYSKNQVGRTHQDVPVETLIFPRDLNRGT